MKLRWSVLPWLAGGFGVGYLIYRYVTSVRTHLDQRIAEKLPVAKDLKTIPDDQGNYDIDGVSYDVEGTVVSGAGGAAYPV